MNKRSLRLIIFLAVLFGSLGASAQFRWGPTVGINFNSFKFKQKILTVDQGFGESVGVNGEMMFPGIGFGVNLGLRYEQLGASLNMGDFTMWEGKYGKERIYIHNLQIPFHLKSHVQSAV